MLCGEDVTGKPRTKDAQGRYACKACLDARSKSRSASAAAPKPAARPAQHSSTAPTSGEDALLANLIDQATANQGPPCEACGTVMAKGAVVCARCGHNRQTGRAIRTTVVAAPKERGSSGGGSGGAMKTLDAIAESPLGIVLAAVCAAIGAAIGAGIYVAVAEHFNREMTLVALACGVLSGGGAWLAVRHEASIVTGVIAAVFAVGGVVGGRMLAYDRVVGAQVDQVLQQITVTDEHMTALVGRDVAQEFSSKGVNYAWPEGADAGTAILEEDFPAPIWTEAKTRFAALSEEERSQKRMIAEAELTDLKKQARAAAVDEAYNESFNEKTKVRSGRYSRRTTEMSFGVVFIGWTIAAAVAAFGAGSGGQFMGGDDKD